MTTSKRTAGVDEARPNPPIERYMSPVPMTIGQAQPMAAAHAIMRQHRIRHLPVLEGGQLVGVVSDGDLHLVETLSDVDPAQVTVEDAMTSDVYAVAPDAALRDVVGEMARRKLGSAVVVKGHKVVGIFTTVDALRALGELLA